MADYSGYVILTNDLENNQDKGFEVAIFIETRGACCMSRKQLPIGYDNFKQIREEGLFYVDKSMLIKDILDNKGQVMLFTRPRRFGKTLNLSMLRYFFEKEYDFNGQIVDNRILFQNLSIMKEDKKYTEEFGNYPVILLSLKSAKQPTYEMSYASILDEIAEEYRRHMYILEKKGLLESEKEKYIRIMNREAAPIDYAKSLHFLSLCLNKVEKQKSIILIDEYDVPLENAHFKGFYQEMTDFIRSLFESALKTNDSLKFAVITGCLRISKESIFTGLNNLKTVSILEEGYSEHFGFTQSEVDHMLEYYHLQSKQAEIKKWYNGYLFGNTLVYNPWSTVRYIDTQLQDNNSFPKPYWANTSSNSIIRELVERADNTVKQEIETLIAGNTIEKPIHEDVTYEDIYCSQDNLWNFLFFTGYLVKVSERMEEETVYIKLAIPNTEVRYIYRNTIIEWFEQRLKQVDYSFFYKDIISGNCEEISQFITNQLSKSISYYDNAENFYHGYLIGILTGFDGYKLESNKEHGNGRPDIVLSPYDPRKEVVIFELKKADFFSEMENKCMEALQQIEDKKYAEEYLQEGYSGVIKYGVCFCRKSCLMLKRV